MFKYWTQHSYYGIHIIKVLYTHSSCIVYILHTCYASNEHRLYNYWTHVEYNSIHIVKVRVQCAVYSVQHGLHIVYCPMYNVQSMCSVQCKVYNVHCTLYTVQRTMCKMILYIVHCTLYNLLCVVYTKHCTLYTVHFTLHMDCTLYTGQYTMCSLCCALYTAQCTLYNEVQVQVLVLGGCHGNDLPFLDFSSFRPSLEREDTLLLRHSISCSLDRVYPAP